MGSLGHLRAIDPPLMISINVGTILLICCNEFYSNNNAAVSYYITKICCYFSMIMNNVHKWKRGVEDMFNIHELNLIRNLLIKILDIFCVEHPSST